MCHGSIAVTGHNHALARSEAVGFHHIGGAKVVEYRFGLDECARPVGATRGDTGGIHDALGK